MKLSPSELPINLEEFELLAAQNLDKQSYDYFRGGANDEVTLRANVAAFQKIQLLPNVLVDVSKRDQSVTVLGEKLTMPILIAPTAFHRLASPEGEIATAKAASKAGTIMVFSSLSTTSPEDVAAATDASLWFQLYIYRDRELTRDIIQRAESLGYKALCITVDAPLLGRREKDVRNQFSLPPDLTIATVGDQLAKDMAAAAGNSSLNVYFENLLDQSITWEDIDWIRSICHLPIVLKGIHRADDSKRAVDHGADAIIVSNHGARQLDTVPATIDMLPPIAEAVDNKIEVLMDGGIRRGTDVIKALSLGARAVLLGRPILWGLAFNGADGVMLVLDLLKKEVDLSMALCGIPTLSKVKNDLVI
ncbi:MAG: alpha-hydroxy-acid oxidizing enzyme [Chloroflexi bacterium]|nr:alpha-hydroxy-acid oxidizing enzyme [Chloroflexota bacterium]